MEPTRGVVRGQLARPTNRPSARCPPGTKVILDVVDTPEWETGSSNEHTPPANPHDYAAFVGALAQHFGTRVSAYEIWNEEDAPGWWAGGPDPRPTPAAAGHLPGDQGRRPERQVVLGGLTGNDFQFLEGVYAAGGKGYFDAVGVHTDTACNKLSPYDFLRGAENRLITDSFLAYREVHAVMLANGDDKPIWMTELSWRTTSATCAEGAWAGQKAGRRQRRTAGHLSEAGIPLHDPGPLRAGGALVPVAGRRRRHLGAAARKRLAQALLRGDARLPHKATS